MTAALVLALSALVAAVTSYSSGTCGDIEPAVIQNVGRFPSGCSWENSTLALGNTSKVTCLWKCCPLGHALNSSNKCAPSNRAFRPRFDLDRFHILTGNPCLEERFQLDDDDIVKIQDDGFLEEQLPDGGGKTSYPAGDFCLDDLQNGTFFKTVALVCDPKDEEVPTTTDERREDVTFLIYTIGRFIALPFLMATVAVYAVIPELRNLHGKCLVSHVTSLSVAYVFLIVVAIGGRELDNWVCVSSAYITYFFLLGSFFWLNIMCFDIWWTFSGHRRVIGSKGSNENTEFLLYSLYAWGAPVVMLCVTLIIEFAPSVPDSSYLRPEMGVCKCWFKDKVRVLAYFSGPVGFLIASNLVFFGFTALNILRIKKETSVLSNADSRRNAQHKHNEQRFVLYLKLFVVMGMTWALDLLGWAVGGPDYLWWVTDLANILQGVLIFVIFVWKERVRKLLRVRFNCQQTQSASSRTASTEVASTPT